MFNNFFEVAYMILEYGQPWIDLEVSDVGSLYYQEDV